jgi:hypothetical protein
MAAADPEYSITETRLYGFQRRLSGYNAIICNRVHDEGADDIQTALAVLFDALTGGQFGSPGRQPDIAAARKAQDAGADTILAARRAGYETASFKKTIWRVIKKLSPFRTIS